MINLFNKIFFVTATIFLVSCTKDVGINSSLDYRKKLEGNYNCTVTKSERSGASIIFDTTYSKTIAVEVDYLNKNGIKVNGELFNDLKLNSNYYECFNTISQFNNTHAKFINDSIYYYVVSGSNGGATGYIYKGKK